MLVRPVAGWIHIFFICHMLPYLDTCCPQSYQTPVRTNKDKGWDVSFLGFSVLFAIELTKDVKVL